MAKTAGNTVPFKVEQCRSCKKDIIWAKTVNGKYMPLDAEPSDKGQVTLQEQDGAPLALYHTVKGRGVTYYVPHFATCPHGKQWSKHA